MHEIISLQLGQASNYIATHFWNTQESYFTYGDDISFPPVDSNVHWRAGFGADGSETFLPRTVIYDLKGGFGSMRRINALYDPGDDPGAAQTSLIWPAKAIIHKLPSIPQSAYQQSLDTGEATPELKPANVRYWSDFSRVFYHPKSLNQMYDYELDSSIRPFDKWHLGQELFQSLGREEDIVDRDFRPFVEESDQMQGIQLFTGLDDAWGGFASDYLDRLRDEYPKTTIWVWGVQASRLPRSQLPNVARSIAAMRELASMLVPLALHNSGIPASIRMSQDSPWHTSALMSTALETASFGSRGMSTANRDTLAEMVATLNTSGNQTMARLQMSVSESWWPKDPQRMPAPDSDTNSTLDVDFFHLTGRSKRGVPKYFGQRWTYRTKSPPAVQEHEDNDGARQSIPIPGTSSVHRRFEVTPFPLLDSFPDIYTDHTGKTLTESAEVVTKLSTDSCISDTVKQLRSTVGTFLDVEEREDLGNALAEIAESYHDGWSSGSDDDDD